MSVLFTGASPGDVADATAYSANWTLLEGSLNDIGEYIISGLVQSAGTGLSVNVTAGVASIGGQVTKSVGWTLGSLTPSTTNHLYLQQNGTGTSNTTGTQPALSVKLGTAVCDGTGVTSVGTNYAAGRQTRRRTEDLVMGSGAGYPRAVDVSSWHATNNEGNEIKGTLAAGALPSTLNAPLTLLLDDANQNSVQTALTIAHSYNAGGGAAGIGVELAMNVESSTNGTLKTAANLQATLTDLTPATATGKLSFGVIANNAQVIPMTVATGDVRIPQATVASAQHGLLNIGSGGFDGSAGHFAGASPGTLLSMNAPAGYTGSYLDVQVNAVRKLFVDQFGSMFLTSAPVATANDGLLSIGDAYSTFDGASGGHFAGNASGTYLAVNALNGFAGAIMDLEQSGSSVIRVLANSGTNGAGQFLINTATGVATFTCTRAAQSNPTVRQLFAFACPADTNLPASTEVFDLNFNMSRVMTWSTGALALQRNCRFNNPALAFNAASVVAQAATVAIVDQPTAGTNATITDGYALLLQAGRLGVGGKICGNLAGVPYEFLDYAFPSDANQTLTASQSAAETLNLSGTVTGTKTLTVTAVSGSAWWIVNGTSAGAVTVQAATGTGITVANGKSRRVRFNGTNVVATTPDL